MRNRAQATLEFTVTFAIMVMLLFSLISIWQKWCNKIITRQSGYSQSRADSGSSNSMGMGDPIPYLPDY